MHSMSSVTGPGVAPKISPSEEMPVQQPGAGKVRYANGAWSEMSIMTGSSTLATAILQRYLDSPAEPVMQQISRMPAPGRIGSHATFNILHRVERPEIPLFRSALTGTGTFINAPPSMGPSSERPTEMPFVKAQGGGGNKLETRGITLAEPRPNGFGALTDRPLQRAVADTSAAVPVNQVQSPVQSHNAGEPLSPSMTPSGTEGLDLERLADEVYAIIEERITVERESLGL